MNRLWIPIALLAAGLCLAACTGDYFPPQFVDETDPAFTITYNYPVDQMREFPLTGSMIVHFSKPLNPTIGPAFVELAELSGDARDVHQVEVYVNDGNLIVTPVQSLSPQTNYELTVKPAVRGADGNVPDLPTDGYVLHFRTIGDRPVAGKRVDVTTLIPDLDTDTVYEFHTFRAYFTEPLDRRTVIGGETIIMADADGEPVEGSVFVRATQVVFDPVDDLAPGRYTLTLTQGIRDVGGEPLAETKFYNFDVVGSGKRRTLFVENCPTLGVNSACLPVASAEELPRHALTGDDANSMLVDSVLLGPTRAFISGQLISELGDPTENPEEIPMVIRKGQRLYTTPIVSQLGGEIPTGLNTGPGVIHVVTDAVGLLHPSDASDGSAFVSFILDAAITMSSTDAGMVMSQNILGTRLFGTATVDPDENRMVLEVAGYAEFFILGERIRTSMNLVMKDAPVLIDNQTDNQPPALRMTSPRPDSERVRLGTALQVLFDEPVTPRSVARTVSLRDAAGRKVATDVLNNGPKLLIVPTEPLDPNSTYWLNVEPGLADTTGNETVAAIRRAYHTGPVEWSGEPPIVVTSSPGPGDTIETIPGHFPVEIWFSQIIDPDTIALGDTVRIFDVTAGDEVPGTLVHFFQRIAFFPNEPFAVGHTFGVVLSSGIRNIAGVRLDPNYDHIPGGPAGVNTYGFEFIAAEANDWVPLRLMLDPVADLDGSGYIDAGESVPTPAVNYFNIRFPLIDEISYASGFMISYVKGLDYDAFGEPFVDIELAQGIRMTSTSTQLDLSALFPDLAVAAPKAGLFDPFGRILVDVPRAGFAPAVESVYNLTQLNITMFTDLNVDNNYLNPLLEDTVPLEAVGKLSFSEDGLMVVDIDGRKSITANFELIGLEIPITLPIDVKMRAVSRSPLSWWNTF
jgi:Bacterial Ig-like domain